VKTHYTKQEFAAEYLHVKKRCILPDKKEWKPYIHYSGLPNDLFWFSTIEALQNDILQKIKKESVKFNYQEL
jgi:hypothetical protein